MLFCRCLPSAIFVQHLHRVLSYLGLVGVVSKIISLKDKELGKLELFH